MNPTHRTATRSGAGRLTAVAVALGLLGLGLTPPAQAAANQYAPSIGTAVGNPLSGLTSTAPVLVTSALCPAGTTAINGFLDGTAAGIVSAVAISSNSTDIGVTNTNGISLSSSLTDIAAGAGKTLVNGRYELSVVCFPDLFGTPATAQFDAVLDVTGGATPTSTGTTYTFVPPVVGPTATTTTISASPASTAVQGAGVTLTATVAPSTAAGTVQFQDVAGGSPVNVGAAATVTGGTASVTVSTLTVGSHSLRAVFTPSSAAAFAASTSTTLAYTVTAPPATSTTTTVAVTPTGTAVAGATVTLAATVTPSNAAGTVQFEDTVSGTPVNVGAAVPVTAGAASATTTGLAVGAHQLRARFVPANAAAFTASTSAATAYSITPPPTPAATTTTTLSASPAGTAPQGSPVSLTASVTPATAVGTVQFQDVVSGTPVTVGNAVAVSGGTATVPVSTLTVGSHSLRAVFTPTNAADFTTSTSAAVAYTITAVVQPPATTTTALSASPADSAAQDAPVTLTAALSPAAAAGTVQFRDTVGATTVNLGTPVTVTGGTATLSTSSLAVGQHSFTAVFTPADPAAFTASTSSPLPYTVTAVVQPPATTTTTVSASPAATAVQGAAVTFTASVTPAAAGTVQLSDTVGGSPVAVGAPVAVTNGSASVSTTALAVGAHRIVATFTPADATAFAGSTSAPLAYTVTAAGGNDGAVATTLTLRARAAGEAHERRDGKGHDEFLDDDDRCASAAAARLEARVAPRAAGTVQFFDTFDGTTTPVGGPVTVRNGRARTVAGPLAAGTHVFTAVFTPADPAKFQGATSNDAPVTIKGRTTG